MRLIKGRLTLFSETGTEGGYWALQESGIDVLHTADDLVDGKCPWGDGGYCPVAQGYYHEHAKYEGLHILRAGDRLKIFKPGGEPANLYWEGTVELSDDTLFQNDIWGMWVHNVPVGVDRDFWARAFFDEYPALLLTKD